MPNSQAADAPPALLTLVETQRWQRLQDHLASALGIIIRTVNPSHELLVSPSWPRSLSAEHVVERLSIGEELEPLLPAGALPSDVSSVTTPIGVTYAAVPIRADSDTIVAYFVVGPMVVGPREDKARFLERVGAMGMDAQAIWGIILALKPYTFSGIHSLLNLLLELGTSLVQFAYQANRLSAILPATSKVDQAVVHYYADRVLNSLLEVSMMATHAEGGSVMVRDGEVLKIRAATGLSDAVVADTRQRHGEGIAGLAASQQSILLVDDHTDDPSLRALMRRKKLVSSLVAPLTLEPSQEPVGVLNLRTAKREHRFTREHMEMLRRLLDLTGIALGNLQSAFKPPRT